MSTRSTSYQPVYQPEPPAAATWKAELNAKLAAHRQRSGVAARQSEPSEPVPQFASPGGSSKAAAAVAARVAERYAKAPSYSEVLAASAAASAAAAETAAFAARQAQQAAMAHARLAEASGRGESEALGRAELQPDPSSPEPGLWSEPSSSALPLAASPLSDLWATIEHPEPLPARTSLPPRPADTAGRSFDGTAGIVDPIAEATVPAAISLPAKLIEFPRELVAARKSRPRIAEGPLAAENEAPLFAALQAEPPSAPALRIFEVDHQVDNSREPLAEEGCLPRATIAAEPGSSLVGAAVATSRQIGMQAGPSGQATGREAGGRSGDAPQPEPGAEWHSIRLGEHPGEPLGQTEPSVQQAELQIAGLADRTMAALVDLGIIGMAGTLFVLVFTLCVAHPPLDKEAIACGALVLGAIALFYQWLFMSYAGATPGMRYAQVALCTFEDDNPTRKARRIRVAASVLSALALGLGFVWTLFDEKGLGWHDRLSRSYQRSYR